MDSEALEIISKDIDYLNRLVNIIITLQGQIEYVTAFEIRKAGGEMSKLQNRFYAIPYLSNYGFVTYLENRGWAVTPMNLARWKLLYKQVKDGNGIV